ncbi:MAG: hypothetical protein MJ175_09320 [Clostridia bacterium]|nr:hypothetical protein [Clostridia bacterium]
MTTIRLDPGNIKGKIKPLHGVGSGPVNGNFSFDTREAYRDAGIPFARTHDTEYPFGSGEFVDIHCVFPNFDADPDDPKNYNFELTDYYLLAILDAGTEPFYRLGTSIEHQPFKRYIHPPKDFAKWGKICSHIISHMNDGWANGHHMGIRYWEIWNEPDLKGKCWTGTDEQFIAFYEAAASVIKADHPEIKIGGTAFTSPNAPLAEKFLAHLKESGAPLDFFSWHGYIHCPEQAKELDEKARTLLDKYGFSGIESIYDEWNYVVFWDDTIQKSIDLHKTAFCATMMTSVMSVLQAGRTDIAMYYDAQITMTYWNGLFTEMPMQTHGDFIPVKIEKPYYALMAWNELYKLGNFIPLGLEKPFYGAAAVKDDTLAVLISNYRDDDCFAQNPPPSADFLIEAPAFVCASARLLDEEHTFEEMSFDGEHITIPGNSFVLLTYQL